MKLTREEIDKRLAMVVEGWSPFPDNMRGTINCLFWEQRTVARTEARGYRAFYNLTEHDDPENGTLSLYQLYMQCATEYEAALVLFGSLAKWIELCGREWFKPYVERWRVEMSIRDAAIGQAAVLKAAAGGSHTAGKILIDRAKEATPKRRRGGQARKETHEDRQQSELLGDVLARAHEVLEGAKNANKH